MRPGRDPGSFPLWGDVVAPLAGWSGASCCVARPAPVVCVLWVLLVPAPGRLRCGDGVCVYGVGLGVMSQRRIPSLHVFWKPCGRRLRTYRMERISQQGFPCGLWHPTRRRLEAAVLRRPLAGPVDLTLEGGLCPGPLSQLPELRVGPALPPLALGRAVALRGGVGVGVCGGIMGPGGGGGPGGVLVVLCRGDAGGAGRWAYANPWVRAHGLRLGVGPGSVVAAVSAGCGLTSGVDRGAGMLLVFPGAPMVWSGMVRGPGVRALRVGGTRCVVRGPRPALP